MKCKVAKSHCKTIGENKNKTNWDTYVVIYTKGYYQCLFYRIRKLFSGDVIPLWVFEICKFESQTHLPGDNYLMQHEILVVHIASHYRSQCWLRFMLPIGQKLN